MPRGEWQHGHQYEEVDQIAGNNSDERLEEIAAHPWFDTGFSAGVRQARVKAPTSIPEADSRFNR